MDASLAWLVVPASYAAWNVYATARGLAALPHLPNAPNAPTSWPKVSVVVPARDEIASIEKATRSKLESDYPNLEIVLVDDRSTDGTSDVVDRLAAEDPRVVAVHVDVLPEGWLGKVHALSRGAAAATGDWLLFIDADIHVAPDVLRRVVSVAEEQRIDFVAMMPKLWSGTLGRDIAMAFFVRALIVGSRLWKVTDPHSRVSVGGGVFNLVRRSAYERTAGFEWIKLELADDVAFGQMMKQSRARCAVFECVDGLGLYFYETLGQLMRGLEKNGYAAMGQLLPSRALVTFLLAFYVEIGPLVALASPMRSLQIGGAALLVVLVFVQVTIARRLRTPLASAGVPAVGALLFLLFAVRSVVLTQWQGGVFWRGRFYPLNALRKGRRLEIF
ncbi:putative glycosyl transferase [Labilithrix luteola]|uniref:Putative glycosyl transferase n=1 Tax=Labilithrix luteola TaxID=1391654 RepID=A0A0K1PTL1_9BACT|nr:glycosyltransferase [Labilithrix luteola]AKU96878.1 putative glycosyl transferase [Labilithrix luteola]